MAERGRRRMARTVGWALAVGALAGVAWLVTRQAAGGPGTAASSLVERLEDALLRLTDAVEAGWDALRDEMERVRQARTTARDADTEQEPGTPRG